MLDFELVHNPPEGLLQFINLLVELLSDLHLKLIVELLIDGNGLIVLLHLNHHLFDHLLHFLDLWRYLDDIVLHLCVLQDTLGTEHGSVILAVKLDLFGGMNVAVPYRGVLTCVVGVVSITCCWWRHSHGQSCQHLVVDWQVLWNVVVSDLVVRTFDHLVLIKLLETLEAEGVTTWQ